MPDQETFGTNMKTDKIIWSGKGSIINSDENLAMLKNVIETSGPVIIEHWHFCGACSPDWLVFSDYEELHTYLSQQTKPGDAIDAWDASTICKPNKRITEGKISNKDGLVPKGGAY